MLLWSGKRCCTNTNAMPGSVSAGIPEKNASKAETPLAEAPIPTIGKSSEPRSAFRGDWLPLKAPEVLEVFTLPFSPLAIIDS